MSTSLSVHRLRFACNMRSHSPMPDIISGAAPITWRGQDLQMEIGLLLGPTFVDDITNITSLIAEIHDTNDRGGPALVAKTVSPSACTEGNWTAGSEQHGLITFSAGDMQLDLTGASNVEQKRVFWLVFHAVLTSGQFVTVGVTLLTVEEDAAQNGLAVVTSATPTAQLHNGHLYVQNRSTEKWHIVYADGADGAVALVSSQVGETLS